MSHLSRFPEDNQGLLFPDGLLLLSSSPSVPSEVTISSRPGDDVSDVSALCTVSFPSAPRDARCSWSSPAGRDDASMEWTERCKKGSGRGYTASFRSSETSDTGLYRVGCAESILQKRANHLSSRQIQRIKTDSLEGERERRLESKGV